MDKIYVAIDIAWDYQMLQKIIINDYKLQPTSRIVTSSELLDPDWDLPVSHIISYTVYPSPFFHVVAICSY